MLWPTLGSTTVLIIKKATVSNSQNVKDSSHGNKSLRKIKINLGTEVEICISTFGNLFTKYDSKNITH